METFDHLPESVVKLIKKSWIYGDDYNFDYDSHFSNQRNINIALKFFRVISNEYESMVVMDTDTPSVYPNIIINGKYLIRKCTDGMFFLVSDNISTIVDIRQIPNHWSADDIRYIRNEFNSFDLISEGDTVVTFGNNT